MSDLSPTAKTILHRLHANGGKDSWWPDNKEAQALRALENRKLVVYLDGESGASHGLPYGLTETGAIAAQLVK